MNQHAVSDDPEDSRRLVFVGTDMNAVLRASNGSGIYGFEIDASGQVLSEPRLCAEMRNSSWLCLHPQRPLLYVVHEVDSAAPSGCVSAYRVEAQLRRFGAALSDGELRWRRTGSPEPGPIRPVCFCGELWRRCRSSIAVG